MNTRQLFQHHVAQTSGSPVGLHITSAKGNYLFDVDGKRYLDLIGGISVCNLGHGRQEIIDAVRKQAEDYLHIMVYGELIQSPQVRYATLLTTHLPATLDSVYFTNSGAEAVEGAIKLARRVTSRPEIICCNNSYHGSTTGALSLIGDEYWRNAFRPLMPGVWHYDYHSQQLLNAINEKTACVIVETIQAEAGVVAPGAVWMQALRKKCTETGTLLICDEIQTGFGRTGKLWAFDHYGIVPDIVLLGKALGGGMPLGAFVSSRQLMLSLSADPVLGHITTFGGHPVCCAAGLASLNILISEAIVQGVTDKEKQFLRRLQHKSIKAVRSKGLLIAVELQDASTVMSVLSKCLEKGLFSDWFLFAAHCIRIAPPLTITAEEIDQACDILLTSLNELSPVQ
jgi:acetylornithine/succinyldiaminopimelate/putrescine aminotransferase